MPDDAASLTLEGLALQRQGKTAEALAAFQKATQGNPSDANAWNLLGLCLLEASQLAQAAEAFRQAARAKPDMGQPIFNLGVCLERLGRLDEAIEQYRRVVQIDPNVVPLWERLGLALFQSHRRPEAIQVFQHILEIAPNSTRTHLMLAMAYEESGLPLESVELARKVLAVEPESSKAFSVLGFGLLDLGDFTQATEAFQNSIAGQPEQSEAYLGLFMSKKIRAEDRPLVNQVMRLTESSLIPPMEKSQLYAILGKALDDLGKYERAIGYADQGNRIALKEMGEAPLERDKAILETAVPQTIKQFPSGFFEKTSPVSESGLPLFILGLPRSGTTLLEQILSSHSEIAAGGEMRFWEDFEATRTNGLHDLLDHPQESATAAIDYLEFLRRKSADARFVTDKSNNNGFNLGVLHAIFPNAKVILCSRNPLDNAISIYITPFRDKSPLFRTREGIATYCAYYKRLLDHWREVLPSSRLIEVRYEDIVFQQEQTARRVLEFCGLNWEEACLRHDQNVRTVDSPSLWQARQPIYHSSVGRWKNYEPWLGALSGVRGL